MESMLKKIAVFIAIILLVALVAFNAIKDKIISTELTKVFQMPVIIKGMKFNLDKLFSDSRKLEIDYVAFGEGAERINFKKLKFASVEQNAQYPGYCFDGTASFDRVYVGTSAKGSCAGNFKLKCIPYSLDKPKANPAIIVRNGQISIENKHQLIINADIRNRDNGNVSISLNGNLPRTPLKPLTQCLNAEQEGLEGDLEIPSYSAQLVSGENIDPIKTLIANSSFIIHDGRLTNINLIDPILKSLKRSDNSIKDEHSFNQLRGSVYVNNAVANLNNISYASDYLRLSGSGSINLLEETINFSAQAKPLIVSLNSILPQGTVYMKITGDLEKPAIKPDIKSAAIDTVKTKVLNKLFNR